MRKIISVGLIVLAAVMFSGNVEVTSAAKVSSAKCATPTFERAFENAKVVFVGVVLSKSGAGSLKTFELEVKKYWKGIEEKKITINVYENTRYQAKLEVGETFLVYAEADDDGRLFDHRCSRTRRISKDTDVVLNDDLEKLGEAKTCISLSDEDNK